MDTVEATVEKEEEDDKDPEIHDNVDRGGEGERWKMDDTLPKEVKILGRVRGETEGL